MVVMATCLFVSVFLYSVLCSTVEKVKNQWDSTQHGVEVRQQQLKYMLTDSMQWDEQRQEMEYLMEQCEIRLRMLMQAPKEMLAKQISDNKVRSFTLLFFPHTRLFGLCNATDLAVLSLLEMIYSKLSLILVCHTSLELPSGREAGVMCICVFL